MFDILRTLSDVEKKAWSSLSKELRTTYLAYFRIMNNVILNLKYSSSSIIFYGDQKRKY